MANDSDSPRTRTLEIGQTLTRKRKGHPMGDLTVLNRIRDESSS